jgi:hypothetical protein
VVANLPHAAAKAARHVPWRVVSHADRSFRKRAHQAPKKKPGSDPAFLLCVKTFKCAGADLYGALKIRGASCST